MSDGSQSPEAGIMKTQSRPTKSKQRSVNFVQNAIKRFSTQGTDLSASSDGTLEKPPREKSTLWILTDRETEEVPGTVVLLSPTRNEPLGIQRMEHHKDDGASIRSRRSSSRGRAQEEAKRTPDGKIVLNPQPEESPNDPLNWPAWRRDCALLSLGFYCMLGGGMTPILAAGFNNVAATFDVSYSRVALTTGLYMMGLGVGSVIASPTAILFGKRTVYLASAILFIASSVWCALAPNYANLVVARVFQGMAVSPVECLPSATIAEIFFLHERAFRVGIYTLLLLGGKNLIPLVSAAVIQSLGWRWVFWIVAIAVGFGGVLLFLFNPETFWDRTPRPKKITRMESHQSLASRIAHSMRPSIAGRPSGLSLGKSQSQVDDRRENPGDLSIDTVAGLSPHRRVTSPATASLATKLPKSPGVHFDKDEDMPHLHNLNSAYYSDLEQANDYFGRTTVPNHNDGKASHPEKDNQSHEHGNRSMPGTPMFQVTSPTATEPDVAESTVDGHNPKLVRYTTGLRNAPAVPYLQSLKPFNGRLSDTNWFRVAIRPFILYAYPSVLWSSLVYSLSVGWLIVLSESVAKIYRNKETYNFSAIGTGLVYVSPFVGGVLGTAVAGKFSDVIVRYMARRNGGIYEPEFRLVMAIPIALCTGIGLMGFGWSAQEHDNFMVPTIFFGIISFGCCIGSTTAITFCVDSYRQFAGEALVTLNFSKNILHGLIWSLFFPQWLESDGPKTVFLAIGGIQLACMLFTIPMYVYGKRARMWTVRKRMMEKF